MRAAVLVSLNAPLEIAQIGFAQILQPSCVQVRMTMAGICGSQLQDIRGEKNNERFLPHCMGHEGVGIVEEIGKEVRTVKVGDKVVCHWMKGEGNESSPVVYSQSQPGRYVNGGPIHTFGTVLRLSENRVTVVPQDTPDELCVLLGCAASTALGVCENEAKLKMGESVLVVGCGGVGLCCIAAAKAMGCDVLPNDQNMESVERGVSVGGIPPHEWDERIGCSSFECIIDTTGDEGVISHYQQMIAPGGRMILVGQPKPGSYISIKNARHLFDGGKMIKATQGGQCMPEFDIPRWVRAWRQGSLKIDGIVTHSYPLDQVNEALDMLRSGKAGRVVLTMP